MTALNGVDDFDAIAAELRSDTAFMFRCASIVATSPVPTIPPPSQESA